jgi:hypothetical protein
LIFDLTFGNIVINNWQRRNKETGQPLTTIGQHTSQRDAFYIYHLAELGYVIAMNKDNKNNSIFHKEGIR